MVGFRSAGHFGLALSILWISSAIPAAAQPKPDPARDLLEKYWANSEKALPLRDIAMDVSIEASLPKLHRSGAMKALRYISKLGKITYDKLTFSGDDQIKKDVIARYLNAERDAQSRHLDIALTPKNYKFKFKGRLEQNGQQVFLYEISPRQKREGLFKGDLWIDADTGLTVRESGRLVRNPSIFFKKTEFTRHYENRDGTAYLTRMQSTVETRIVGKVEMDIRYSNFTRPAPPEIAARDDSHPH